jgi:hypothetical protein
MESLSRASSEKTQELQPGGGGGGEFRGRGEYSWALGVTDIPAGQPVFRIRDESFLFACHYELHVPPHPPNTHTLWLLYEGLNEQCKVLGLCLR